jgi:hypothetical protein
LEDITALPYIQFIGAQPDEPVLEIVPIAEGEDHNNAVSRVNYLNTGYNGLNYISVKIPDLAKPEKKGKNS